MNLYPAASEPIGSPSIRRGVIPRQGRLRATPTAKAPRTFPHGQTVTRSGAAIDLPVSGLFGQAAPTHRDSGRPP
jgi:hypothetical protein